MANLLVLIVFNLLGQTFIAYIVDIADRRTAIPVFHGEDAHTLLLDSIEFLCA